MPEIKNCCDHYADKNADGQKPAVSRETDEHSYDYADSNDQAGWTFEGIARCHFVNSGGYIFAQIRADGK